MGPHMRFSEIGWMCMCVGRVCILYFMSDTCQIDRNFKWTALMRIHKIAETGGGVNNFVFCSRLVVNYFVVADRKYYSFRPYIYFCGPIYCSFFLFNQFACFSFRIEDEPLKSIPSFFLLAPPNNGVNEKKIRLCANDRWGESINYLEHIGSLLNMLFAAAKNRFF